MSANRPWPWIRPFDQVHLNRRDALAEAGAPAWVALFYALARRARSILGREVNKLTNAIPIWRGLGL